MHGINHVSIHIITYINTIARGVNGTVDVCNQTKHLNLLPIATSIPVHMINLAIELLVNKIGNSLFQFCTNTAIRQSSV